MSEPSAKWRERLLYLISPIGLLLLWQILVSLGFGDRRFIPTPSDIAARFWQLTVSGELAVNTLATLWRVVAGFVIGVVPAVAVGLLMAMFRPVRIWEETGKTVVYITHSIEEALLLGDRTVVMTAQPGRIKEIIDVPFPHPRNLMALSASAEFGRLKLDIWRLLEDEVNRARAELER